MTIKLVYVDFEGLVKVTVVFSLSTVSEHVRVFYYSAVDFLEFG